MATYPQNWIFEVKASKVVGIDVVRRLEATSFMFASKFKNPHLVLVVSGQLTSSALTSAMEIGIEVWDCNKLLSLASDEVLERYFGQTKGTLKPVISEEEAKGASLLKSLESIEPGKKGWPAYQKLSSDIVEYLWLLAILRG